MNAYSLTKKEMNQIEKDFSKTVLGRKARLPVLLSIMFMIVWLVVTVSLIYIQYVCAFWAWNCGYSFVNFVTSEPMSYFISFLIVVSLCFLSYFNYNKELRKYIASLD